MGYQQCGPEQQWGPGIRDHYCSPPYYSGKGTYVADKKYDHLGEGDSFILYPDTEVKYYADPDGSVGVRMGRIYGNRCGCDGTGN